jgi:hypothetical protein
MKNDYKERAIEIFKDVVSETTLTKPGALPYLIFGEQPSYHSFFNKMGKNFEKWFEFLIRSSGYDLSEGKDKLIFIGNDRKDMDLVFRDEEKKVVYYMEMKSNTNLDTEKFKSTCNKIINIKHFLSKIYGGYEVKSYLLHWSVYDEIELDNEYKIRHHKYMQNGVKVIHPKELFEIINVELSSDDYKGLFKEMKNIYNQINHQRL